MYVYRFRPDMVYDCPVEVPDGTPAVPRLHTFIAPPVIPDGYYCVMSGGWKLVQGEKPMYPPADDIMKEIIDRTQMRLDDFAKTRIYDGILSACTYATSSVTKFRLEGQYCVDMRDSTWNTLYQILADIQGGLRPIPSGYSEIESELPTLTWPV